MAGRPALSRGSSDVPWHWDPGAKVPARVLTDHIALYILDCHINPTSLADLRHHTLDTHTVLYTVLAAGQSLFKLCTRNTLYKETYNAAVVILYQSIGYRRLHADRRRDWFISIMTCPTHSVGQDINMESPRCISQHSNNDQLTA